ncbi:MAG: hypothetical protein NVSMB56_00610 [Pyrinomonadaceae bacterium]
MKEKAAEFVLKKKSLVPDASALQNPDSALESVSDLALDFDAIISWAEVNRVHRIRNGVYQRGGRLISLLTDFGRINPCYPDTHDENIDTITYTGAGRHGDQHLSPANRALLAAIESAHAVPLFCKLSIGRWRFLGLYRVINGTHIFDATEQRMLWRFTLKKC